MAVTLEPMTKAAYQAWLEGAVSHYAQEIDGAGYAADPRQRAKTQFAELLPQGPATPGHHLYQIRDGDGAYVGVVWLSQHSTRPDMGFVYTLEVFEAFRRRGLGRDAMLAVEAEARALGCGSMALHVFGANTPAINLYRTLGYEVTDLAMKKSVGRSAVRLRLPPRVG